MTKNQYREQYEAALGEFLLRYNQLESTLNAIVEMLLQRCGKMHLYESADMFARKLNQLELLCLAFDPMHYPDFAKIRTVNADRIELAHGHLNVDPNTGDIKTVKAQSTIPNKGRPISPEQIKGASGRAKAALDDLQAMLPYIYFAHTP